MLSSLRQRQPQLALLAVWMLLALSGAAILCWIGSDIVAALATPTPTSAATYTPLPVHHASLMVAHP